MRPEPVEPPEGLIVPLVSVIGDPVAIGLSTLLVELLQPLLSFGLIGVLGSTLTIYFGETVGQDFD